jgi:hypothetical protein
LAFDAAAVTIPWPGAYLTAEEGRLHRWQKRLGNRTAPRIGIAWSGAAGYREHRDRSIALDALGELLDIPVDWVCRRPGGIAALQETATVRRGD